MKIVYIIDKPNMYGSERHLLDIIHHFQKVSGYNLELISFSDGPMLKNITNVTSSIFKLGWIVNVLIFYRFYCCIKKSAPDIIHCHQPKALFYGALIGVLLKVPTIITVHSKAYDHAIVNKNMTKRSLVFLFHTIVSFVSILFATKIIYVNKKMYDVALKKSKSVFISNWLPKKFEECTDKSFSLINNKRIKLISVGSVTKAKGYDLFLDFLSYLDKGGINYSSAIYGSLDEEFYLSLKEHNSFSNKVKFLGYSESIIDAYKDADFYVLFSRSETFGLSYLEAMSQGLPIIALDLDELKDLIPIDNILALDVEHAYNKFIKILNWAKYNQISKKNIQSSKKYSHLKMMKQLDLVYKGIQVYDI
jgi:glycosyltransferase involved in cell wall biosynthesis